MKKKVYLTLANGKVFQGYRFGAIGEKTGELVFSTGMVGYVETLTDPCNYGQIVVQTFPLIGNYGVNEQDVESDCAWLSAYVVREICDAPSNFRSEGDLESFMKKKGVVGVYGVDTRELTKILREEGSMNARISDKPLNEEEIKNLAKFSVKDALSVTASLTKKTHGDEKAKYKVALWNLGGKNSTAKNLVKHGCCVIDMPTNTTADEILSLGVDGVVLGDGAGNPADNVTIIEEVKKLIGKTPIFGMGLGHQILALAFGGKTSKLKSGHRGSNQPVKCEKCGKVFVSSQNHSYVVLPNSVPQGKQWFFNVNDGSCEGMQYEEYKALGVQFNPEACSIGNPENPVYKKFFTLMDKEN